MPRPLAGCSETLERFNEALQRFRIYPLSYEALQRFIEALSNLTRPSSCILASDSLFHCDVTTPTVDLYRSLKPSALRPESHQ